MKSELCVDFRPRGRGPRRHKRVFLKLQQSVKRNQTSRGSSSSWRHCIFCKNGEKKAKPSGFGFSTFLQLRLNKRMKHSRTVCCLEKNGASLSAPPGSLSALRWVTLARPPPHWGRWWPRPVGLVAQICASKSRLYLETIRRVLIGYDMCGGPGSWPPL